MTSRAALADFVAALLADGRPRTAQGVADDLRGRGVLAPKAHINAVLYDDTRFKHDSHSPLRWSVRAGAVRDARTDTHGTPVRQTRLPTLYEWQRRALKSWRQQQRLGVVQAVTGTGKTAVGLAAAAEAVGHGLKVLVLVPTVELQRQWRGSLSEALPNTKIGLLGGGEHRTLKHLDVLVSTVQSATSGGLLPAGADGLLIADEVHRYGAEKFSMALDAAFSRRLGLTATYERNDEGLREHLEPYFGPVCTTVDYAEAVPAGYVSRFKIALVGARLTPSEMADYAEFDESLKTAMRALVQRGQLQTTPFGEFMKSVAEIAQGQHSLTREARQFLHAFAGRRQVLGESVQKLSRLEALIPSIRAADRTLVFSQTINAAEAARDLLAAGGVRAASLHSDTRPREREDVMVRFKRHRLDVLTAAQVLDEGIDVPQADLAIILAATQTRRQMIQRVGRVLRLKKPPRLARVVMMYAEETPEDPALGGHGDFLDLAIQVADAVEAFPSNTSSSAITDFVSDVVIRGPARAPQPIPVFVHGKGAVSTRAPFDDGLSGNAASNRPARSLPAAQERPALARRLTPGAAKRAVPAEYVAPDVRDTSRLRRGWRDFDKWLADLWEAMTGTRLREADVEALRTEGLLGRLEEHRDQLGPDLVERIAWTSRKKAPLSIQSWIVDLDRVMERRLTWREPSPVDVEGDAYSCELLQHQPSYRPRAGLPAALQYGDDT